MFHPSKPRRTKNQLCMMVLFTCPSRRVLFQLLGEQKGEGNDDMCQDESITFTFHNTTLLMKAFYHPKPPPPKTFKRLYSLLGEGEMGGEKANPEECLLFS